ncbi:hypothetical protein JKF63_07490 [Porcisia hertigi]|uniref:Uncharacterized protein n=1 Tax=Porcisia hertigi TaxID=2761500 RepID=A0A836IYZ9_9TRYP|nr:hypothetical protein JKF63_07490 [Porcisia hertigi]
MSLVSDVSKGSLIGSDEGLPAKHPGTPPASHCTCSLEATGQRATASSTEKGLQLLSNSVHEAAELHQWPLRPLPWLSESELASPAELWTGNSPSSAPSYNNAASIADGEHIPGCTATLAVSVPLMTLESTRSLARCVGAVSPSPPSLESLALSTPLPSSKGGADKVNPSYGCGAGGRPPATALGTATHRSSTPLHAPVGCVAEQKAELEAMQPPQPPSTQLGAVVHKLLSTERAVEPTLPVALRAARHDTSYVYGTTMQDSFSPNDDCVGSSEGGATATTESPLMRSNTSRAATTTTTTSSAGVTTATAHTLSIPSPSKTATLCGSGASAPARYTTTFPNKASGSANGSAAVAEAALLFTSLQSPPRLPNAFLFATAAALNNDLDEDRGDTAPTAAAIAVAASMPPTYCLPTAPATDAQEKQPYSSLSCWLDVSNESVLSAVSPDLRACLSAECDRAVRAVQRQEVWAEETHAGRERLRLQIEMHTLASHYLHHLAEKGPT